MKRDPVLHLEKTPGRAWCGRSLPTGGFFTDCEATFEEREGSRCASCWRSYFLRRLAGEIGGGP
jgi:hypothetical protein